MGYTRRLQISTSGIEVGLVILFLSIGVSLIVIGYIKWTTPTVIKNFSDDNHQNNDEVSLSIHSADDSDHDTINPLGLQSKKNSTKYNKTKSMNLMTNHKRYKSLPY